VRSGMKSNGESVSDISDRVVQYIVSRGIDELGDLTVNSVAREFNMNRSYLSNRFKADKNIFMHDYILMIKILRSLVLLEGEDITVEILARKMGFSSAEYFRQVFKRIVGTTPGNYKKWHRKGRGG